MMTLVWIDFIGFRRDEKMGLFQVLLWCAAVVLRGYSRFGEFDSRLCPNKFPFPPLRELASRGLICLAVFAAKTAVIGKNR